MREDPNFGQEMRKDTSYRTIPGIGVQSTIKLKLEKLSTTWSQVSHLQQTIKCTWIII